MSDDDLNNLLAVQPDPYLYHLTALPLPAIKAEPDALRTHAHHLTSSLTSLTHSSYPAFLALHASTGALTSSLAFLSSSLAALLDTSLPNLEASAATWSDRTHAVLSQRRRARGVLELHDKLRDLLDVPVLIETCVRNGFFAEALSLAAHVRRTAEASAAEPAIFKSLLAEVDYAMVQMRLVLLGTLHEPGRKLPALFKAVSFLRQMRVFDCEADDEGEPVDAEEQLALAFLTGRETCLRAALDACQRDVQGLVGALMTAGVNKGEDGIGEKEKEDVAKYLKKYIDVWREGVYDLVTQYTTIFFERSPTTKHPDSSAHASLRPLLASYTTHVLTLLLIRLSALLPHVPPAAHAALLTQLTYCATACARVGLDFSGALAAILQDAVQRGVGSAMREAGRKWEGVVRDACSGGKKSAGRGRQGKGRLPPSQWLVTSSTPMRSASSSVVATPPPHIPPPILASYPPLAEFTNALLQALNGLRLLAPVELRGVLGRVLDGVLGRGVEVLLEYAKDGGEGEGEEQEGIVRAVGAVYLRTFVPFMRRALREGVYGVVEVGEEEILNVFTEWETWLDA